MFIIDDDFIFTKIAKFNVAKHEFSEECESFENAEVALAVLKKNSAEGGKIPDIILLDINMPIIDGWEFLDEFSKLNLSQNIPVFISTSSINPDDIERSKSYSMVKGFISKPLNKEKFDLMNSLL